MLFKQVKSLLFIFAIRFLFLCDNPLLIHNTNHIYLKIRKVSVL